MSVVDALQDALAIEHQVIYGYGVVGAHVSNPGLQLNSLMPSQAAVQLRLRQHQELRDHIAALVRSARQAPVSAATAYQLPFVVTGPSAARRLGLLLEQSVGSAAYDVIAASERRSPERALMIRSLTAAADWQARWTVADLTPYAVPFPGRPGQPAASQPSTTPTSSPS